jgi:FAD/FMN-containing dehydrogenase
MRVHRKPLLIARCSGTADVADAVKLGNDLGLEIVVRGGGHNVAGNACIDGGLMIDLSPMQAVHVDISSRTARVQGGATWRVFNRETQLYGLSTTGGVVSTTGVGGLTLGDGLGWLMPKYGMAIDNLLAADVITATGKVLRASADSNPDLFWVIRSGGENFGVVTDFLFQLHAVGPMVYGGLAARPFEKARDMLRCYRDRCESLSNETMAFCGLVHAPDGSGTKLVAMTVCHCGDLAAGEASLKPLKSFGRLSWTPSASFRISP